MENLKKINQFLSSFDFSELMSENDSKFAKRVFENGIEKYVNRLKQINFTNTNSVLDAGCGFGQWSLALSLLNSEVTSIDFSQKRVDFLNKIKPNLPNSRINFFQGEIENIDLKLNQFDLIFCYGVIFLCDWKLALSKLIKLLKPGGKIYVNANDIGWYIFLWETEYNKTSDYNPKKLVSEAFMNTYNYENNLQTISDSGLILNENDVKRELIKLECSIDFSGPEGYAFAENKISPNSFFEPSYKGMKTVFELIATKNKGN